MNTRRSHRVKKIASEEAKNPNVVGAEGISWNEIKDELVWMWQVVERTDELSLLTITR